MTNLNSYSPQRDSFLGAVGLLIVGAFASALVGSTFGFVALGGLIGILCTRAQWARIVVLVIAAYVGLVGLLVGLIGHGSWSLGGLVAGSICGAIFWLLVRPGMDIYFGASRRPVSQVVPVPRPGALPHLQPPHFPPAAATRPVGVPAAAPAGSTHEQWERLQQQLRSEHEREEREAQPAPESRQPFPWFTFIFTVLVYAYAASVGGSFGQFSLLLVIPGFVCAIFRWVNPRVILLASLVLSGGLIVVAEQAIVATGMRNVLQHQGPAVFAAAALLVYLVLLCSSGLAGDCEEPI